MATCEFKSHGFRFGKKVLWPSGEGSSFTWRQSRVRVPPGLFRCPGVPIGRATRFKLEWLQVRLLFRVLTKQRSVRLPVSQESAGSHPFRDAREHNAGATGVQSGFISLICPARYRDLQFRLTGVLLTSIKCAEMAK